MLTFYSQQRCFHSHRVNTTAACCVVHITIAFVTSVTSVSIAIAVLSCLLSVSWRNRLVSAFDLSERKRST